MMIRSIRKNKNEKNSFIQILGRLELALLHWNIWLCWWKQKKTCSIFIFCWDWNPSAIRQICSWLIPLQNTLHCFSNTQLNFNLGRGFLYHFSIIPLTIKNSFSLKTLQLILVQNFSIKLFQQTSAERKFPAAQQFFVHFTILFRKVTFFTMKTFFCVDSF